MERPKHGRRLLLFVLRLGKAIHRFFLQIFSVKRETYGNLDENCVETEDSLANGTTHRHLVMLDYMYRDHYQKLIYVHIR